MNGAPEGAPKINLEILSGSRAGVRIELTGTSFTVGRDPASDLRFDPGQDLAVSSHHALISNQGGRWFLTDRGSLNGTLLNGEVITEPVPLRNEDRIQFGEDGPVVRFRTHPAQGMPSQKGWYGNSPGHRVLVWALSVALVVVLAFALKEWLEGRRYARQFGEIQAQIDSVLIAAEETVEDFRGRNEALGEALSQSRDDLQELRSDLEAAERRGDSGEIESLRIQLQEAQAALVRQQMAAAIDYESIEGANGRAVAKVFVDFGNEVTSATAFAVRADGILLTNRHVVAGASGSQRAERIAVQFADSRQFWPARVVGVSQTDDLAALKVDNIVGDVPTVAGFNMRPDTMSSGQAVAVIGFPLGGANPSGEGEGQIARTTLTTGIIGSVSERLLRVNGYGVEGSSGSPIFDRSGLVVGVLYGGEIENGERTLHAVPATKAAALLDRVF